MREEILRKKELRRQMQAGFRKKELLERLNSQTNTQGQGPDPAQVLPAQPNPQTQQPVQQQQPPPPPPQQQQQPQQQRQFPQRTPQSLNHTLKNPNQGNSTPLSSSAQTPTPRPNVKTRLQMVKGSVQQQQTPGPGPQQQWKQPRQNQQQQQKNSTLQNVNTPGAQIQSVQVPQKNIPVMPVTTGLPQTQGPKPGAKRTVMQRAKNSGSFEGQQVPQKVRVVKLSGAVSIRFHFYLTPSFMFWPDIYLILSSRLYPQGKLHSFERKCH